MTEVELKAVKDQLEGISSDVKKAAEAALKAHGELSDSTKRDIDKLISEKNELKGRLEVAEQAIVDRKSERTAPAYKSIGQQVVESELAPQIKGMQGGQRVTIDVKAAVVSSDLPARVVPFDRIASLPLLQRRLFVRDIISAGVTGSNALEYVRMTGFTNNADPVTEGARKPTSVLTYDLQTTTVKTIAHIYKASKQILADFAQLSSDIDNELRYGLKLEEESQILNGSGTGANLHGIIPQATAYSGAFTPTSEQNLDVLRLAILQSEIAQLPASAVVMHPTDWAKIELSKDSQNRYLFAAPVGGLTPPSLWGLPIVSTLAMTVGHFLTGGFDSGATVYDREAMNVQIATQNEDDFVKNMITVRCEERLALVVKRPEAFIYGAFI